ncbi:cytochrome P450 [Nocardia sp. NPDC051570]|uniref:cytochrome P450 n=1 Tax=Nocardia sp. NPDC051570 TaxID=3364324 RepID=UPI0037950171
MHYPLQDRPGVALDPDYLELLRKEPLVPVELAGGRQALLVTRHADVCTVVTDHRFSREAWNHGTLFARRSDGLALLASDAPTHTRRRAAVQGWFTGRRAAAARPRIEQSAERLIDEMEQAGPPSDLIARFIQPLSYGVTCDMLAVPTADLELLLPSITVMMSMGRYSKEEVDAAHNTTYTYSEGHVARLRHAMDTGAPGHDLLTALLAAGELSEEEIITFGFGLLISGGETTTHFLSSSILQLLSQPGLAETLRDNPSQIPAAIDECLRWVWFGVSGGRPHVVLEEVELAGVRLAPGQVVIPMAEPANRDPSVFEEPDEFRPDRCPNPHVGLGYGRHRCLGAPHALAEMEIAIATLLRRLPDLAIAVEPERLDWRDKMFIRGVWSLPVTWSVR